MTGLSSQEVRGVMRKRNMLAIALCLLGAIVILAMLSSPLYEFQTCLFEKKSGNTFVGDERYVAAAAEVAEAAAEFERRGAGGLLSIQETVTERVNSKGETTSLVNFRINLSTKRTGWDFMRSTMPNGVMLRWAMIALTLALVLAAISLSGALDAPLRGMAKWRKGLRGAACWLGLISLVLLPVFAAYTTRVFNREIVFQVGSADGTYISALLQSANDFLYNGQVGERLNELLSQLTYRPSLNLWLIIPMQFIMLCGLILLCRGELGPTLVKGALYLFVIVLCVVILYPYYVMLITGFRSNSETTDMYFRHLLPTQWVWSNVNDIVQRGVPGFLLNSLTLSFGATVIALVCGIPAAYAMARMSFRGKKAFLGFVIMSQMFAPAVLLVGISRLMNTIHLNDSVMGLMLINAAFNQAFAIWLLRGTFVSISSEMEQAACIDGCSTVGALLRVLLPMAAPGIVTTLIFVFINSWNEYTISTVLISTPAKKPITVGITQFSSFNMIEWQYLFASALFATIPVIIMFMCIEKHLVSGLTAGGVKG